MPIIREPAINPRVGDVWIKEDGYVFLVFDVIGSLEIIQVINRDRDHFTYTREGYVRFLKDSPEFSLLVRWEVMPPPWANKEGTTSIRQERPVGEDAPAWLEFVISSLLPPQIPLPEDHVVNFAAP